MSLAVNCRLPQSQSNSGNKKYQIRNKKIKELTELFDQGRIDVQDFLESMASDQYRMCYLKYISHLSWIRSVQYIIFHFQGEVHEYYDPELDSDDDDEDEDEDVGGDKDEESDESEDNDWPPLFSYRFMFMIINFNYNQSIILFFISCIIIFGNVWEEFKFLYSINKIINM